MLQNGVFYDANYYIDYLCLCILEFVKVFLLHLVNTVHISSVALSPWIMNIFGLHINQTSFGAQIVISTFC